MLSRELLKASSIFLSDSFAVKIFRFLDFIISCLPNNSSTAKRWPIVRQTKKFLSGYQFFFGTTKYNISIELLMYFHAINNPIFQIKLKFT